MVKSTSQDSKTSKEKIKWALVAILGGVLLFVLYSNLRPSDENNPMIVLQENQAEAVEQSIDLPSETQLMPALEMLSAMNKKNNTFSPSMIQDIFSFASRRNGVEGEMVGSPEEEAFVLKGTIIDGDNSVAFLNDEVMSLGETVSGYTLVEITAESATIKNGEDVITVLPEKDEIDEKLQM
jgi:hypothetical protein